MMTMQFLPLANPTFPRTRSLSPAFTSPKHSHLHTTNKLNFTHIPKPDSLFSPSPSSYDLKSTNPISCSPILKPSFLCGNSSNSSAATNGSDGRSFLGVVGEGVSTAFPLWVALGCLLGLVRPSSYNWVQPQWIVTGITVTMLGMGMTLTLDDLGEALAMPKELLAGFFLQYSKFPMKGVRLRPPDQEAMVGWYLGLSTVLLYVIEICTVTAASFVVQYLRICFSSQVASYLCLFPLTIEVMPLSGFFISKILNLPSYYAAGLILVGCCPGGTASNIVTYIARGNVALSVLMTALSTVSAVVMTPFLTAKLAGQYVAVDAMGLLMSTLQVVLLPVLAGAFLNQYFKKLVKLVSPLMPPIAVATVAILCGNAIAQSSSAILTSGRQVVIAAALLHTSGFFFGYVLARLLGIDVSSSRTISIEVGMQNSVLGVVLATQHFGNPLTAVPCAVSSVCHSILGSALAGIWRRSVPVQIQN